MRSFEFPGFRLEGSPVFTGARGSSMFSGSIANLESFLDLGMVFGSRLWGHDLPALDAVDLGAHGMGDLFTHDGRERACAALCDRVATESHTQANDWRALVLHTGSEAVETALKTALRVTGRDRMLAYERGYHGTFGLALSVTHGVAFRAPWAAQYRETVTWAAWGEVPALDPSTACVVVEPWQGRAGVIPPPRGFLALLREECYRVGALLVLDAVLCGSGRTGPCLVESIAAAQPDLVCLGKALGSGYTASAVVARSDIAAAAWDQGPVEPAHTSTSLGDPVAAAGILRTLVQLDARAPELRAAGSAWRDLLTPLAADAGVLLRGTGLLWAIDTGRAGGGTELAARLLSEHRILTVPSGPDGSSVTLYPPATCSELERERVDSAIRGALQRAAR